jgi:exodeoxyribonuclease-5
MLEMSHDQEKAITSLLHWYKTEPKPKQFITLGGYAGTGKTTLIAILRNELAKIDNKLKVGFASYTGKASRVLKTKLQDAEAIAKQDTIGTIHSLIYSPVVNDTEEIIGWKPKDELDRQLIIIDEGSMVDSIIWTHLLSYKIPIIVVGDHGQLPPIRGSFNLMQNPELKLEEIHRQARNNPIIGLSIQAREHGMVKPGDYGSGVKKYTAGDYEFQEAQNDLLSNFTADTLILCGYNNTRVKLNSYIRNNLGFFGPHPSGGDRVICLRNNHKKQIFNGMLGTVVTISKYDNNWYSAEIAMDGDDFHYSGLIAADQFDSKEALNFTDQRSKIMAGDLFDFGYALTVHKAQGSQAKRVILFEERFSKMDGDQWRRWLYTAVTRAEEELYIFGS